MNAEVRDFLLKAHDSLRGARVLHADRVSRFHRYLIDAEAERIKGDYGPVDLATEVDANRHIARAEEFLETAERLLASTHEGEPPGAL